MPPFLAQALDAHDAALGRGESVLKDDARTAVTRVSAAGEDLCVKEFRRQGLLDRLKDRVRETRETRAWSVARHLEACGLATPSVVAVVSRAGRRYLITRWVQGSVSVDRLLRDRFAAGASPGEIAAKRATLAGLGSFVRRVHDQGIYHGDFSAKNVLMQGDGGREFLLLDLDGISTGRTPDARRRAKNLAQLVDPPAGLTRADQLRVVAAYAEADSRSETRALIRRVAAVARERRRRRERHWERYEKQHGLSYEAFEREVGARQREVTR